MVYFIIYSVVAYIVGFYIVSGRAKKVIKFADRLWDGVDKDRSVRYPTEDIHIIGQAFLDYRQDSTKEDFLLWSRFWHIVWILTAPIWILPESLFVVCRDNYKQVITSLSHIIEQEADPDKKIEKLKQKIEELENAKK